MRTYVAMAVVLIGLLAPAAGAGTVYGPGLEVFLEENATYRYVNATTATFIGPVPANWYEPGFDDSSWFVGQGAFGSGFGASLSNASGSGTPNAPTNPGGTPWGEHFDPYLRTTFTLSAPTALTLWLAVDNGVNSVYLNGVSTTAPINAEGAAFRWEHVFDIPAAYTFAGTNTLALQLEDHGSATAYALVLTADDSADQPDFSNNPPPTPPTTPAAVPLPAPALLGGLGLGTLALARRIRRRRAD